MIDRTVNIEPVYNYFEDIVAYKIINLIDTSSLNIYSAYFHSVAWQDESKFDIPPSSIDFGSATTYSVSNDVLTLAMLDVYTPLVRQVMNRDILPSYTYTRVYEKGTQLLSHRDRASCEISMTVNLYQEGTEPEPFYVSNKPLEESTDEDITKILSYPGDAIIFKGQEFVDGHYHWRDPTKSKQHLQGFLHWVYADGNYVENAYGWKK